MEADHGTAPANGDTEGIQVKTVDPQPVPPVLPAGDGLTDRQMRVVEVLLLCAIAFAVPVLNSAYLFLNHFTESPVYPPSWVNWDWTIKTFRELSILALLWYVLQRRGKSFSSLGMTWKLGDFAWSVVLFGFGMLAFRGVYNSIVYFGPVPVTVAEASLQAGRLLFGTGISSVTFLFQFVNPFFEELIVRGYLMTEIKALTRSVMLAVAISTVLQMSYHFYQGAAVALGEGATFLVFSIFYAKTGRITPVILAHLYQDVIATSWFAIHN
jgi:membrane protease YdiL (CAAX protease family)